MDEGEQEVESSRVIIHEGWNIGTWLVDKSEIISAVILTGGLRVRHLPGAALPAPLGDRLGGFRQPARIPGGGQGGAIGSTGEAWRITQRDNCHLSGGSTGGSHVGPGWLWTDLLPWHHSARQVHLQIKLHLHIALCFQINCCTAQFQAKTVQF